MSALWVLAAAAWREAARRKLVLAGLLAAGGFLLLYGLAFHFSLQNPHRGAAGHIVAQQVLALQLLMGLYAAVLLSGFLAVLAASDAIAGDIASGAIHTLLSKPVGRWQLLLGKWLGLAGLLSGYLALLAGGIMALAWRQGGVMAPHPLIGLGLMWMEVMLLLTVALLWSTRFSTLAAGALSLGMFGFAFLGGWIEQVGALSSHPRAVQLGIAASLIMPSEALWRRAAYEMQSPLMTALSIGPFTSVSVPDRLMVIYAGVYTLAALALAMRRLARRDL